jgi:hypothetical protein
VLSLDFPLLFEWSASRQAAIWMIDADLVGLFEGNLSDQLAIDNFAISRKRRDDSSQRPVETRNVKGT